MSAAPPVLAPDLTAGLRRLKLAAMRRLAPELLVTAMSRGELVVEVPPGRAVAADHPMTDPPPFVDGVKIKSSVPPSHRGNAYADTRHTVSVVREQAEFVHPGDCRSARGDAELPVNRNCLRLHGVSCDVETLADLAQGEVGGQQRQESQLGRGE